MASDPVDIDILNQRIPLWVEKSKSTESPIEIADCSTEAGYTPDMSSDGTHPNVKGDRLIANQIGPHLVRFVREAIAERKTHDLPSVHPLRKGNEEDR